MHRRRGPCYASVLSLSPIADQLGMGKNCCLATVCTTVSSFSLCKHQVWTRSSQKRVEHRQSRECNVYPRETWLYTNKQTNRWPWPKYCFILACATAVFVQIRCHYWEVLQSLFWTVVLEFKRPSKLLFTTKMCVPHPFICMYNWCMILIDTESVSEWLIL